MMKTFLAITMPLGVILSVCVSHPVEATASHTGATPQHPASLILVRGGGGGVHVGGGEFHGSPEGFSGSRTRENQGQRPIGDQSIQHGDAELMRSDKAVDGWGGTGIGIGVGDFGVGGESTSGCSTDSEGNVVCD
ncbi:MAG: hypothetical protein K2W92_05490 [Alphaproteobacteria bacterium]|nr:hypothetical protein [Alphaproteobacteria bacterium]